jgi:hypothetical protein
VTPLVELRPTARPDVSWAAVGDAGLVYDPRAARIHRLNATGLLVWRCCDGTATVGEIAADLAHAFGRPAGEVAESVTALIDEFTDSSLLVVSPEPDIDHTTESQTSPSETPAGPPPPNGEPLRRLGPYSALDHHFVVECHHSDAVAAELDRTLAPLAHDGGAEPTHYTVFTDGDSWFMEADSHRLVSTSESGIVGLLLWHLNRAAVDNSGRFLILHAAAVGRDGEALVLPAVMNSGKSTLATLLVQAGYRYLTDEAAAIDLDTGEVVAYPKAITLDPGTQALLPHLEPVVEIPNAAKWQVPADEVQPGAIDRRLPLRHIVFPTWADDADNVLVPIAAVDAVIALALNAFNLAEHANRLADIVALVERCTTHTLRHHGLAAPVTAIHSLW